MGNGHKNWNFLLVGLCFFSIWNLILKTSTITQTFINFYKTFSKQNKRKQLVQNCSEMWFLHFKPLLSKLNVFSWSSSLPFWNLATILWFIWNFVQKLSPKKLGSCPHNIIRRRTKIRMLSIYFPNDFISLLKLYCSVSSLLDSVVRNDRRNRWRNQMQLGWQKKTEHVIA